MAKLKGIIRALQKREEALTKELRNVGAAIAASILAARKLAQWDGRPSPAVESCIAEAIATAERIMAKIDNKWPTQAEATRPRSC